MKYYKIIENEKLLMIGTGELVPGNGIEVTETVYNQLLSEIKEHVKNVEEYVIKVKAREITMEDVPDDFKNEVGIIIAEQNREVKGNE